VGFLRITDPRVGHCRRDLSPLAVCNQGLSRKGKIPGQAGLRSRAAAIKLNPIAPLQRRAGELLG
jgi:hypothetical protein